MGEVEVVIELPLFETLDGEVAEVWLANLCPTTFYGDFSTFVLAANRLLITRL